MKTRTNHHAIAIVSVLALTALAGCGRDGAAPLSPGTTTGALAMSDPNAARISIPFDPNNFGGSATNPFFPLEPGTRYSYVAETADGRETNDVEVTHQKKTILGVTTTVIRDKVFLEGTLIEDTFDWYAADKNGNVWYFGEDTKSFEDGAVSTVGSWEAGVNDAKAGIIMLANPKIGDQYFQENAPGVVEDQGKVLSLKEVVTVPYGTFTGCLETADWTPIEPGNRAFKFYAPGIGLVLEITSKGGQERVELTGLSLPWRYGARPVSRR